MEYLVPIKTGFEPRWRELKDWFKQIPGVSARFDPMTKKFQTWVAPLDMCPTIAAMAKSMGVSFRAQTPRYVQPSYIFETVGLYTFQASAVQTALDAGRRWIFALEMGLGKTACAIRYMGAIDAKKVLVCTPAIVRSAWLTELDRWWPNHPDAKAITHGRSRRGLSKRIQADRAKAYEAPIQIASYALIDQIDPMGWDCIVLDEAHRLKNDAAKQSKQVRAIIEANPKAAVIALTGTLMPDQPKDVWNILDLLWPERFGKKFAFYNRYSLKETITGDNGEIYGTNYYGVNSQFAPELKTRLALVSSRVTKNEVAHLLPPFLVQTIKIEATDAIEVPATFADWQAAQNVFNACGDQKVSAAIEWAIDALESGATHICILTHRRETAENIAAGVQKACGTRDVRVSAITGASSPEARNEELANCKEAKSSVVVATMHSIGIGIDLTFCTQALFAELYYRPETVIQAIGRFSRLSGKVPSSVQIMCIEGTPDETMAHTLQAKIAAINATMEAGLSEAKLQEALTTPMDEDSVLMSLNRSLTGVTLGESLEIE